MTLNTHSGEHRRPVNEYQDGAFEGATSHFFDFATRVIGFLLLLLAVATLGTLLFHASGDALRDVGSAITQNGDLIAGIALYVVLGTVAAVIVLPLLGPVLLPSLIAVSVSGIGYLVYVAFSG